MKDKIMKKHEIATMIKAIKTAPTKHIDKKVMDHIRSLVFERLRQYDVYQDDAWVMDHYQQLLYAVESLYTYIYTKKNSHLTKEDAKVFASYISDRVKKLKDIIEQTN